MHEPPELSPLWVSYLAKITQATDSFWLEERRDFRYLRLQGSTIWAQLRGWLKQVMSRSESSPLSELEWFLLLVSTQFIELGWQIDDAPKLLPGERYRASGQEIRQRFAQVAGRNDLGLSLLKPQRRMVDALAGICELFGEMVTDGELAPLAQSNQAGGRGTLRLPYLAALLRLVDLLSISERSHSRLRSIDHLSEHDLEDARLALEPYISTIDMEQGSLGITYALHPDDQELQTAISSFFEMPLKRWWAANWRWLSATYHFRLTFQLPTYAPVTQETVLEPLSQTCPALSAYLQQYIPAQITLPSLEDMTRLNQEHGQTGSNGGITTMFEQDQYVDFSIRVEQGGLVRATSLQGERKATISLEELDDIQLTLELIKENKTSENLLRALGKKLYALLFSEPIDKHFNQTEAVARSSHQKVRIRLSFEPQELAPLPWEFLYRSEIGYFLAINPDTVLSRYLDLPLPPNYVRKRPGPLHMLLIISSPIDQPSLNVEEWQETLEQALSIPLQQSQLTLKVVPAATIKNIQHALQDQEPDIVQFIGHGAYQQGKGYLALVNERTLGTKLMDDAGFADLFLGMNRLGLVCLATCESAKSDAPQGFQGLAPQLVQRGIPAVIAMQYNVRVKSALIFLESLYRSAAARRPIDWSVQHGRNAISAEQGRGNREFATPVLYMRAQDGAIF